MKIEYHYVQDIMKIRSWLANEVSVAETTSCCKVVFSFITTDLLVSYN